jgi:putative flippase GtrA
VGGFNTVFGYSTFALLNFLLRRKNVPASYIFAVALSTLVNVTVSYSGYKLFVFRTKGNYIREWSAAMAVSWSAFLPTLILLPVLVQLFNLILPRHVVLASHVLDRKELAPYVANAFLTGVAIIYTFIGHKYVTFRPTKADTEKRK